MFPLGPSQSQNTSLGENVASPKVRRENVLSPRVKVETPGSKVKENFGDKENVLPEGHQNVAERPCKVSEDSAMDMDFEEAMEVDDEFDDEIVFNIKPAAEDNEIVFNIRPAPESYDTEMCDVSMREEFVEVAEYHTSHGVDDIHASGKISLENVNLDDKTVDEEVLNANMNNSADSSETVNKHCSGDQETETVNELDGIVKSDKQQVNIESNGNTELKVLEMENGNTLKEVKEENNVTIDGLKENCADGDVKENIVNKTEVNINSTHVADGNTGSSTDKEMLIADQDKTSDPDIVTVESPADTKTALENTSESEDKTESVDLTYEQSPVKDIPKQNTDNENAPSELTSAEIKLTVTETDVSESESKEDDKLDSLFDCILMSLNDTPEQLHRDKETSLHANKEAENVLPKTEAVQENKECQSDVKAELLHDEKLQVQVKGQSDENAENQNVDTTTKGPSHHNEIYSETKEEPTNESCPMEEDSCPMEVDFSICVAEEPSNDKNTISIQSEPEARQPFSVEDERPLDVGLHPKPESRQIKTEDTISELARTGINTEPVNVVKGESTLLLDDFTGGQNPVQVQDEIPMFMSSPEQVSFTEDKELSTGNRKDVDTNTNDDGVINLSSLEVKELLSEIKPTVEANIGDSISSEKISETMESHGVVECPFDQSDPIGDTLPESKLGDKDIELLNLVETKPNDQTIFGVANEAIVVDKVETTEASNVTIGNESADKNKLENVNQSSNPGISFVFDISRETTKGAKNKPGNVTIDVSAKGEEKKIDTVDQLSMLEAFFDKPKEKIGDTEERSEKKKDDTLGGNSLESIDWGSGSCLLDVKPLDNLNLLEGVEKVCEPKPKNPFDDLDLGFGLGASDFGNMVGKPVAAEEKTGNVIDQINDPFELAAITQKGYIPINHPVDDPFGLARFTQIGTNSTKQPLDDPFEIAGITQRGTDQTNQSQQMDEIDDDQFVPATQSMLDFRLIYFLYFSLHLYRTFFTISMISWSYVQLNDMDFFHCTLHFSIFIN